MLNIGSLSAWITVDDTELPQYGIQYSPDGKQVTCWVPSEIDKKFCVCWNESHRLFPMLGRVYVDGTRYGGKYLKQRSKQASVRMYSADTSPTTERPFVFSRLELTDDDLYLNTAVSPELGDIKLEITEVHIMSQGKTRRSSRKKFTPLAETDLKVHERAKKGSAHRVKLGEEVACHEITYRKSTTIRTLGTFIFKYRPLDILQANGLAPLQNKHNPAVASDETLDLTLEDDSEKIDRKPETAEKIKRLEEELRILKESGGSVQKTKRIKTEVKTEPHKLLRNSEVIDLT